MLQPPNTLSTIFLIADKICTNIILLFNNTVFDPLTPKTIASITKDTTFFFTANVRSTYQQFLISNLFFLAASPFYLPANR